MWNTISKTLFLLVIIEILCTLQFAYRKCIEIKTISFQAYVNDYWNYLEMLTIILTITENIFIILFLFGKINPNYWLLKFFTSTAIFFIWIQLLSFLRGFSHIAPFITMIIKIAVEIKYFILILLCLLLALSFAVH